MAPTAVCTKKQALTEAFIKAVSEYNRVQTAQISALCNDDGLLFEDQIKLAREVRDAARFVLAAHQQDHGC